MSGLVSIIIPIYNLENYIEYCLNSVVNQTYKELEILCIDDGSTDKSAEIIKRFASSDSRIKYFYQDNAGVSAARNKGLDEATGEYVMFVDGDDYIHSQMVDIMVDTALKSKTECVFCDFMRVNEYNSESSQKTINKIDFQCDSFSNLCALSEENIDLGYCVWGKLFIRENIKNLRFKLGCFMAEDSLFSFTYLTQNIHQKIAVVNLPLYFYYKREGSAVNSKYTDKHISWILTIEKILNLCFKTKNNYLIAFSLNNLYMSMSTLLVDLIGTRSEEIVKQKSYEIGMKYLGKLILQRKISIGKKIYMISLFFLQTKFTKVYKQIRIMLDHSMKEEYERRANERI